MQCHHSLHNVDSPRGSQWASNRVYSPKLEYPRDRCLFRSSEIWDWGSADSGFSNEVVCYLKQHHVCKFLFLLSCVAIANGSVLAFDSAFVTLVVLPCTSDPTVCFDDEEWKLNGSSRYFRRPFIESGWGSFAYKIEGRNTQRETIMRVQRCRHNVLRIVLECKFGVITDKPKEQSDRSGITSNFKGSHRI